eukprot:1161853-Pelagomonas_calceolata.AAC.3
MEKEEKYKADVQVVYESRTTPSNIMTIVLHARTHAHSHTQRKPGSPRFCDQDVAEFRHQVMQSAASGIWSSFATASCSCPIMFVTLFYFIAVKIILCHACNLVSAVKIFARLDSMIEEARAARTEALAARSGKARHALQAAQAQSAAMTSQGELDGEDEEGDDATPSGDAFSRMSIQVGICSFEERLSWLWASIVYTPTQMQDRGRCPCRPPPDVGFRFWCSCVPLSY